MAWPIGPSPSCAAWPCLRSSGPKARRRLRRAHHADQRRCAPRARCMASARLGICVWWLRAGPVGPGGHHADRGLGLRGRGFSFEEGLKPPAFATIAHQLTSRLQGPKKRGLMFECEASCWINSVAVRVPGNQGGLAGLRGASAAAPSGGQPRRPCCSASKRDARSEARHLKMGGMAAVGALRLQGLQRLAGRQAGGSRRRRHLSRPRCPMLPAPSGTAVQSVDRSRPAEPGASICCGP